MASSSENVSMALFCDFENVALGVRDANLEKFDIKPILERLLLKGSIVVKKAYCDWDRYKGFKATMHEANFELIEIPHVRQSGKNSADIRLVVDALDLCYTKSHVNTFVIISGDSDFSPLVSKLRENAKQVIGVGVRQSTSDLLVANCDEFIFYDDLVRETRRAAARHEPKEAQPAPRRPPEEEKRRKDESDSRRTRAVEMAAETFEALLAERGDTGKIWASVLKDAIKRRKPDFSETRYGFRAFGNLLEEAQARGLLEIGRDEKSGTYVYRSGSSAAAEAAAPAENLAAEIPEPDDEPAEIPPEVVLDRDALPRRAARRGGHLVRQPDFEQGGEAVPAAEAREDGEPLANRLPAEPPAQGAPLPTNEARRPSRRGRGRKKQSPATDLISEQSALEAAYAEHVAHSEFAPPELQAEPAPYVAELAAGQNELLSDEAPAPAVDPVDETGFDAPFESEPESEPESVPESAAPGLETSAAVLPPAPQAEADAAGRGPRRRGRGGRKASEAQADAALPEAAIEVAPELSLEFAPQAAPEAAPDAAPEAAPRRKGRGGRKSAAAKDEAALPDAAPADGVADATLDQPAKKPAARRRPRKAEE